MCSGSSENPAWLEQAEGGEDGQKMKLEREPRAGLCLSHGENHRFYSKVDGVALLSFEQGNDLILFAF